MASAIRPRYQRQGPGRRAWHAQAPSRGFPVDAAVDLTFLKHRANKNHSLDVTSGPLTRRLFLASPTTVPLTVVNRFYVNLPETHAIGQPPDNLRLSSDQNSCVSTIRQTAN